MMFSSLLLRIKSMNVADKAAVLLVAVIAMGAFGFYLYNPMFVATILTNDPSEQLVETPSVSTPQSEATNSSEYPYEWKGKVFPSVTRLTLTEVNSLDPSCVLCREIHAAIQEGLATTSAIAYQFRIFPNPSTFSDDEKSIVATFYPADIVAYCLSPQVGGGSETDINEFVKRAFANPDEQNDTSAEACSRAVNYSQQVLGAYAAQIAAVASTSVPLVILQAPGAAPARVGVTVDNIRNLFLALQNDSDGVVQSLKNKPEHE